MKPKITYILSIAIVVIALTIVVTVFINKDHGKTKVANNVPKGTVTGAIVRKQKTGPLADVILQYSTGREGFFGSFSDVYVDHYHAVEYHNGDIYLMKRVNYSGPGDTDWQDELWEINSQLHETKIYSGKGFDFRVSPDENYVAIREEFGEGNDGVRMVNTQTGDIKSFIIKDLFLDPTAVSIDLVKWADDSQTFWGAITHGQQKENYFRLIVNNWDIAKYESPGYVLNHENDLNPNTGVIAYSDYPVVLAEEDVQRLESDKAPVHLYVKDLITGHGGTIATSSAKRFHPVWQSAITLMYDNPSGSVALTYTLTDNFLINTSAKKLDDWSVYRPMTDINDKWIGSDECGSQEFAAFKKAANVGPMYRLVLPGELELVWTPNYDHWSNDKFLAFGEDDTAICAVGGRYPLKGYPDKLLWRTSCGSGVDYSGLDTCESSLNKIEEYFK